MAEDKVIVVPQLDARLGRNVWHRTEARRQAFSQPGLPPSTRRFRHRVYSPRPNPSQRIGNCTGCATANVCNTAGNRVKGVILGMDVADKVYARATQLDPWEGVWPPEDTGSSGAAAALAAQEMGLVEHSEVIFGGDDEFRAALALKPISVGTWWYSGMFDPDPATGMIRPTGRKAGGHQYMVFGWDPHYQAYDIHCWWNGWAFNGRARIHKDDLAALRADDGDAMVLHRARLTHTAAQPARAA